jgi:hypothetical protein
VTSVADGLRVETQNENAKTVTGFVLTGFPEMIADDINRATNWTEGADVSKFAGKSIRLRFAMKDAELYSLRFC